MRLYQHIAHCPVAIQLFLEHNPNYWCFVPMSEEELVVEERIYIETDRSDSLAGGSGISFVPETLTQHERNVSEHLNLIPLPLTRRHFSAFQLKQQRLFFDRLLFHNADEYPFVEINMYQMKIIAVCK